MSSPQGQQSKALDALFPGPRRLILSAIFGEPDRWWSLPDLAGRAGVQPGSVRHHVVPLRDAGLVLEKVDSGKPWFQPNRECPVYTELQAIVRKLTPVPAGYETILIVEDTVATAQITRILLESWGYRVLEAHKPEEALGMFDQHREEVRLLLTDVMMPGMTGPQLADELQGRDPGLRVVFMSGYPSDHLMQRDAAFLPKPFNPTSLSRMVRKELDRPEGAPRRVNVNGS
jgi:CheY-like chemotaxis protein